MSKTKAAILGATGAVGQRFIQYLDKHPDFELVALCASDSSAGKKYCELGKWVLDEQIPESIANEKVLPCAPKALKECGVELVFSALPSDIAHLEKDFAKDFAVCSNAATHRMEADIPLLVPEVNPEHMKLIDTQREKRGWNGFLATNPNCSTVGLVMALKPIQDNFRIKAVTVTTMQALSGAGYPGVPSLAINDNVIPHIQGEEHKMQTEPLKILGKYAGGKVQDANFNISASCNRVNVSDGHTESVFLSLEGQPSAEEVEKALMDFKGEPQKLKLHTAPEKPIIVYKESDRPQPRKDRWLGKGMSVSVGNIRKDFQGVKFTVLSHNTIRGAAGASILNAELLKAKGYI